MNELGLPLRDAHDALNDAVMAGLGENHDVPPFTMYSEVFQDALVDLSMLSIDTLRAGLTSLGWSAKEADAAVAAIDPDLAAQATDLLFDAFRDETIPAADIPFHFLRPTLFAPHA